MTVDAPLGRVQPLPVPPLSQSSTQAIGSMLADLRQAARDASWSPLLQTSLTLLGAGHGHALAVRAVRGSDGAQAALAMDVADQLRSGLEALAARADHATQAADIRAHLESVDADLAARAGPLLDQVAAGQVPTDLFAEAAATAGALGQAPGTETEAALCVAAVVRGLVGLAHTVVNTASPRPPDVGSFPDRLDDLQLGRSEVDDRLRSAELALFAACVGEQQAAVSAAAGTLAQTVEDLLVPFVAQQAQGAALVSALRGAGRNGDAERVGAVLAEDGWLLRRAVADAAAATMLRLDLSLRQPPAPVLALLNAQGVPFDANLPDESNRTIPDLSPTDDGSLVEVGGFVAEASAAREPDGKLVGHLLLEDPSSGTDLEVSTLFVHPPHVGITLGSFVTVHGTYQASSARLGGRPGVETDVLAPVALSEHSWQARLWFAADPWFEVWRNGNHLSWSLGQHTAGPDDSEEATRGAAELIYAPFARTP